jgi:hyperosmotically inducible periplasmic protein
MKTNKRSPIMIRLFLAGLAFCLGSSVAAAQAPQPPQPQAGTAAQIGEKIDRGLSQIGAELKQGWEEVRKSVEKMSVQGRVYGRLHWDKDLENANLDVTVRDNQVVVLSGSVASPAAKQKAEQLARDTIGVGSVVNELTTKGAASPK